MCVNVSSSYIFHIQDIRFNTLRPRQNGHQFPDDIFKCIFLNENEQISITISVNVVPLGTSDDKYIDIEVFALK